MNTIQELVKHLEGKGCELFPCSKVDIIEAEKYFNIELPLIYKEFLLVMGNGAGAFMRGSSVFLNELYDLKDGAIEIMHDNNLGLLPDNAFVFWLHQGYQMAYFLIDGPSSLPVYYFGEGAGINEVKLIFERFIDFLDAQLRMSGLSVKPSRSK
ncbi:hypothetical protein GO495_07425 [Chitinophaga oryziterrae]|uniref:Knr4/Smi1-like domain-containing protein n=1 Tax=Chitinophaga oryziterrae TaxID=1031224 RepID=A0A6N8J745_9BACT|nr:SMI1/KNR4 family protein [Chitinophaga oryziterrae]MVT40408.1 hypothetical protein [Chitinophaga oryziterrae]